MDYYLGDSYLFPVPVGRALELFLVLIVSPLWLVQQISTTSFLHTVVVLGLIARLFAEEPFGFFHLHGSHAVIGFIALAGLFLAVSNCFWFHW